MEEENRQFSEVSVLRNLHYLPIGRECVVKCLVRSYYNMTFLACEFFNGCRFQFIPHYIEGSVGGSDDVVNQKKYMFENILHF